MFLKYYMRLVCVIGQKGGSYWKMLFFVSPWVAESITFGRRITILKRTFVLFLESDVEFFLYYSEDADVHTIRNPVVIPSLSCLVWEDKPVVVNLPLESEKCNSSVSLSPIAKKTSLVKWIEDGVPEDPFLNPELMKNNPWVEKGKCILL